MTKEYIPDYLESLALCMADCAETGNLDGKVLSDLALLMADLVRLSREEVQA